MTINQSAEILNREYRHGLVAAQIEIDLPLQLRALRKKRGWTQPEMAERTGMKQSRFPLMERPGSARFNLETLRRLAEAFDVALIVRFAPFSELLDWSKAFSPDAFDVPSFEEELGAGDSEAICKGQSIAGRLEPSTGLAGSALHSSPAGFNRVLADRSSEPAVLPKKSAFGATNIVRQDLYGNRQGATGASSLAV